MRQFMRVLETYLSQLDSNTPNHAERYTASTFALNLTDGATAATGEINWNSTDETVNIGMANGVTQQIGQETYARVQNTTGSTIPDGSVVGIVGATATALLVAPFLADGVDSTLDILGVMTHELPDSGELGYCTVWGFVRNLDTSAFTAGDTLYASPTVAGGFTTTKPTAPDNVVPVAVCVVSHATTGVVFVRPVVEQEEIYGVFSDTTTFTPAAAYTPYAITFNTTDIAHGISRGSPTSRIVVSESGLYNFQYSAQASSASASAKRLWIWPRVNGVDVPNTNGVVTVSGAGTVLIPAWNWVLSLAANDYFELVYATDDTNVQIITEASTSGSNGTPTFARPAVPSVILTVTQVQQ